MLIFIALLSGALFGLGLLLSGMMNPEKILGFLDLFGQWDPTLALVMVGALGVFAPGYWWFRRQGRGHCVLGDTLPEVPAARFDRKLWFGAPLFGIGWGLAGICPGPALGLLASLQWQAGLFVAAMIAGFWLVGRLQKKLKPVPIVYSTVLSRRPKRTASPARREYFPVGPTAPSMAQWARRTRHPLPSWISL